MGASVGSLLDSGCKTGSRNILTIITGLKHLKGQKGNSSFLCSGVSAGNTGHTYAVVVYGADGTGNVSAVGMLDNCRVFAYIVVMAASCDIGGKIRMIQLDSTINHSDYHIGIAHCVRIPYRLAVDIIIRITGIILSPHLIPVGIIDCDVLLIDSIGLYTQDTRHGFKERLGACQGNIAVVFNQIPAVKTFGTRTWLEFSGIREKALERRNADVGYQITQLRRFCT